jgi:F-type H+-transporting ATPase subunit a
MTGQAIDIGEIILHHTADASEIETPFGAIHLPHWPDVHLGGLTINFSPTKHVVFMILAALLVLVTMGVAKRGLERQRAHERAPSGFAGFVEQVVLWLRDDVAIASIGHRGARFAPFVVGLFFFILYMNLLGLLPWGATATGNLAVTATLALVVFLTVEISGFMTLGGWGYLRTIFPHVPGVHGAGALVLALAMAPIEILGKLVKPFALSVRLFGNMTAGHFVVLSLTGIILFFGNWLIGGVTAALIAAIMLLELLVAALQAYVFALLAATFIGLMQREH